MADATYCRASPLVWDDDVFVALSDLGRTVWFALLLGPQVTALPGLQRGSVATIADTLRRPVVTVAAELEKLHDLGRVCVVDAKRVVWVPNAPKHNQAESPNHIRAWWRRWNEIPDCYPRWAHVPILKEFAGLANEKHASAWACTFEAVETEASRRTSEALPKGSESTSACACARSRAAGAGAEAGTVAGAVSGSHAGARPRELKPDVADGDMPAAALRVRDAVLADADLAPIVKRPNALAVDLVVMGPGLDVLAEVRAAAAWLRANPAKRKSNGNQFLGGWVKREQDRRGGVRLLNAADSRDERGRVRQGHLGLDEHMPRVG